MLKIIFDCLNNNQGVISAIGLIIILPFAVFADRIISCLKKISQRKHLKKMLIHELWLNIFYTNQINESYGNNFMNDGNIHLPKYPPRTEILKILVQFDILNNLIKYEKEGIIEIYAGLENFKSEFIWWHSHVWTSNIIPNKKGFILFSEGLISHIDILMQNMLAVLINLVSDLGEDSSYKQIRNLFFILRREIKKGKKIYPCYRSSYFNRDRKTIGRIDLIVCWKNDIKDCDKEIIEIQEILQLDKLNDNYS